MGVRSQLGLAQILPGARRLFAGRWVIPVPATGNIASATVGNKEFITPPVAATVNIRKIGVICTNNPSSGTVVVYKSDNGAVSGATALHSALTPSSTYTEYESQITAADRMVTQGQRFALVVATGTIYNLSIVLWAELL